MEISVPLHTDLFNNTTDTKFPKVNNQPHIEQHMNLNSSGNVSYYEGNMLNFQENAIYKTTIDNLGINNNSSHGESMELYSLSDIATDIDLDTLPPIPKSARKMLLHFV